jgi:GNAT superfamily N-acetyltransferase
VKTVHSTDHLEPQLANARDYWRGFARTARTEGSVTLYRSDVSDHMYNGVLRVHSNSAADMLAQIRPRLAGVPWIWWVGPDSSEGLAEELLANGAEQAAIMPVMAVDLDSVVDVDGPPGLDIQEVKDWDTLQEWVRVYGLSLGLDAEQAADVSTLEVDRPDTTGEVVRLAGWLDGQLVGTSMLLNSQGVAGVYVVTTRPEFRGRGIGTRMTAAALRAGQERGLEVGTLQSSGLGVPVYRRMGFRRVSEYRIFTFPER